MVGLSLLGASQGLFPQVGAEIVDQLGKVFPVERPNRFALEGGQKPQFQAEPRVLAALNPRAIRESLSCFMNFS